MQNNTQNDRMLVMIHDDLKVIKEDVSDLKVSMGRLETKVDHIESGLSDQKDELKAIEERVERLEKNKAKMVGIVAGASATGGGVIASLAEMLGG